MDEKAMSFLPIGLISFDRLAKVQAHTDWLKTHKGAIQPTKDFVCFSLELTEDIEDAIEEAAAWDRIVLRMLINVVGHL